MGSYLARFPVVSCPPDGMNQTCLTNPPGSSNAFIVKPANIGKFAAQAFAKHSPEIDCALQAAIAEKIVKLEKADEQLAKRQRPGTKERQMLEGNKALAEVDPEMYDLIGQERHRQYHGIELIASENFTSGAVMECLGACLTN